MTAFLQTSDGDLEIVNGRPALVTGATEKAQKITNRLALATGEWFADTSQGIPWFGLILGQKPDLPLLERLVSTVILSVEGMADVLECKATYDGATRAASVNWRALTDEGVEISGGVQPYAFAP